MINKAEIKCRFRRSVESYDDNAYIQRNIVEKLYGLLEKNLDYTPERTLEIGCGTGLLTWKLKTKISNNGLYVNDLVDEMCSKTINMCQLEKSHSLVGDIEELPLSENFDLIVSASTFQWFTHPSATFEKLSAHMKSGSLLVFSTFGRRNLWELREITGNGLPYFSLEELKQLLLPFFDILHMEDSLNTLCFSDPLDILQHLKKTGANANGDTQLWTKGRVQQFIQKYNFFIMDAGYPLTYHPLYFICRKK